MIYRPAWLLQAAKAPIKWGLLRYESLEKYSWSKVSLKWRLLSVGIAVIILFLGIILFLNIRSSDQASNVKPVSPTNNPTVQSSVEAKPVAPSAVTEQTSSGLPARLKIPKINLDAAVEHVGLTADATMDVPKDPANVAWYELGTRPGEIGSAVIAGHYGPWKNKKISAFNNLAKLSKGDKLYVEDDKGVITTFVVQESRSYDPNANASSVFGSNDGKAHLNLITCEGTWSDTTKSYSSRLVVFTTKE